MDIEWPILLWFVQETQAWKTLIKIFCLLCCATLLLPSFGIYKFKPIMITFQRKKNLKICRWGKRAELIFLQQIWSSLEGKWIKRIFFKTFFHTIMALFEYLMQISTSKLSGMKIVTRCNPLLDKGQCSFSPLFSHGNDIFITPYAYTAILVMYKYAYSKIPQ